MFASAGQQRADSGKTEKILHDFDRVIAEDLPPFQ